MKFSSAFLLVLATCVPAQVHASKVSPIAKVLEMIAELQSKIISEGQAAQKIYEEYSEWCEEQAKNLQFEIKTGKAEIEDLKAVIGEETAVIESLTAKVDQLSGDIATDEADLKAATAIREKEAADFGAEEKEGMEIIDTLQRAIRILEKEMKGGASMLRLKSAQNVAQALSAMVKASVFNSADAGRLTALVQSSSDSDDDDDDAAAGAPAGEVYKSQSGSIVETLEDLLEKAQTQLDDARKKEQTSLYNFEMLKQSLDNQIATGNKNLDKAKKGIAEAGEKKATAEGELEVTTKDLKSDEATLAETHHACMTKAADFEAETTSRGEELKAIAEAKKIIIEATGGALDQESSEVSFLQMRTGTTDFQAVRFIRKLAKKHKSAALAQLAKRMASAIRFGNRSGDDPFAKVKGLIADMISKLESEGEADASHKAYCDKEMSETKVKFDDKTAEIEKLTTSIDEMSAQTAKLKEEVAALQKELADLAASQAEMDKLRQTEHEAYVANKAESVKGLEGIKLALKVLRDYYGSDKSHAAAEGAGGGIIDLLEVCESDFEKEVAQLDAEEETAATTYETETKENEIDKANKDQDVKYKTMEATNLDKAIAEASSDLSNVQTEIAAVNEYWEKLKDECLEKVEPYEEKVKRREAEIAGLKEALEILDGEAVLLQQSSTHHLRGIRKHA
jgi:chromosome segregation ATPase